MILNVPDTRQSELSRRLQQGRAIVAADVAREFDVSIDTIRRDLLALEAEGVASRVRGGAVPVARPAGPLHQRLSEQVNFSDALIARTIREIADAPTLIVDGGTTTLRVIEALPRLEGRLVITPSPWIAVACQKRGEEVFLLGGRLRPQGGIATGDTALMRASETAADIALLGACGIEAEFGVSSDDHDEALMKRAMQAAARRTIVVTGPEKIGRRARHQTLALAQIDILVTDIDPKTAAPFQAAGMTVVTDA